MKNRNFQLDFWPTIRLNLWWACSLISIGCIISIDFTEWHPFVRRWMNAETAEKVNRAIASISYSILAASIFYMVNELWPKLTRKKIIQKQIHQELSNIGHNLMFLISLPRPFSLLDNRPKTIEYTEDSFASDFCELNLLERSNPNALNLEEVINRTKNEIQKTCHQIMTSYNSDMTVKELMYVDKVLSSNFITNTLTPMIFELPQQERIQYPSNQEFIGRSIYQLYSLPIPFHKQNCKIKVKMMSRFMRLRKNNDSDFKISGYYDYE